MSLSNGAIAELLARASETEEAPHRQRALRRASRAALQWPEEGVPGNPRGWLDQ